MLQSIKTGDAVLTKNGQTLIVVAVEEHNIPWYPIKLHFNNGAVRSYMLSGMHHYMQCKHDIVKVMTTTVVSVAV